MAGRPTGPCTRSQTARYGHVRPVTAVYTARSRQCIRPCTTAVTAVRHVHTSTPQLKGRVRAKYTSVYTASTQSCTWQVGLHGRVHWPRRHVTAVGRVHGRNASCTRSCTRPIHSRVHVRLHGSCTRPHTRTVCRNGPHTAVACRLETCTRPGRPTCRIHGPDGPCTRPSTWAVTRPCTRYVDGRKGQCTRPVYTAENGRAHGPYTAVYTSRYGPYTAVYTTRYMAVYGRVDGRFRPCRWPVHGRVDVPCTGPCTRHVHGRRRQYRRPVHSHVHGWCRRAVCTANTRRYTGRVYGTAVTRPCTGRFRGRRRVHGPCTRLPCNGHTTRYTAVYTAVDGPYTDV